MGWKEIYAEKQANRANSRQRWQGLADSSRAKMSEARTASRQASDARKDARAIAKQHRATNGLRIANGQVYDGATAVGPLKNARAEVSTSGQLDKDVAYTQRHTVTRYAAFGLASVFVPKKSKHVSTTDTRKVILTVSGEGFTVSHTLRPQDEEAARLFAAQVNTQGQL